MHAAFASRASFASSDSRQQRRGGCVFPALSTVRIDGHRDRPPGGALHHRRAAGRAVPERVIDPRLQADRAGKRVARPAPRPGMIAQSSQEPALKTSPVSPADLNRVGARSATVGAPRRPHAQTPPRIAPVRPSRGRRRAHPDVWRQRQLLSPALSEYAATWISSPMRRAGQLGDSVGGADYGKLMDAATILKSRAFPTRDGAAVRHPPTTAASQRRCGSSPTGWARRSSLT